MTPLSSLNPKIVPNNEELVYGHKTPNQADTLSQQIIFNTNFKAQTLI